MGKVLRWLKDMNWTPEQETLARCLYGADPILIHYGETLTLSTLGLVLERDGVLAPAQQARVFEACARLAAHGFTALAAELREAMARVAALDECPPTVRR